MVHTRRPLQISVWTMLLGSTILTGYFAGYNSGGRQETAQTTRAYVYARNYGVSDMVRNTSDVHGDLQKIIAIIMQNVEPQSWFHPGVGALPYDANQSIIIQQTEDIHAKISDLLTYLRNRQNAHNVEVVIGFNDQLHTLETRIAMPTIQIWHLVPSPIDSAG